MGNYCYQHILWMSKNKHDFKDHSVSNDFICKTQLVLFENNEQTLLTVSCRFFTVNCKIRVVYFQNISIFFLFFAVPKHPIKNHAFKSTPLDLKLLLDTRYLFLQHLRYFISLRKAI